MASVLTSYTGLFLAFCSIITAIILVGKFLEKMNQVKLNQDEIKINIFQNNKDMNIRFDELKKDTNVRFDEIKKDINSNNISTTKQEERISHLEKNYDNVINKLFAMSNKGDNYDRKII